MSFSSKSLSFYKISRVFLFADLADIELYMIRKITEILKKITIFLALRAILHSFCVSSTLTLKSVDTM